LALSPEKMDELKAKYGITDEAIYEIADSLEPDSEAPETPNLGLRGAPPAASSGGLPQSLASAMRGDVSIAEAIILMDFMDRKEDRRERRSQPQDSTGMKDIIAEMREERKHYQDNIERLILGKRAEDSEEKARRLEEELKQEKDAQRQRENTAAAVKTAVSEVEQRYGNRIDEIANQYRNMTPTQQKGFFDEIAEELGTDLKNQFKEMITARLQPPKEPIVKTDEAGKATIDWAATLERGFDLGEKWINTQKDKPKLKEVQPMPPGGARPPLVEAPPEPLGGEPEEEPQAEEPTARPPVPISGIAGIGPAREKELAGIGITDAQHLAKLSPKHLAETLKISKDKAEDIIKQAKDQVDQA